MLRQRRWQLCGFLAVIVLMVAVAGVALGISLHTAARHRAPPHRGGSQSLRAAAAIRAQAVRWILQQVSPGVIVSCDPLICNALAAQQFPASSLLVLEPGTPDPGGSAVVVATPAMRSQYGSQLESDYAPDILASFGSGSSHIDIRVVASGGTAPYQAALAADVAARKASGAALLHNRDVTVSATAASQLSAGQVDSRLLTTLAQLASLQAIDIVAFADSGPGASAGMPLRSADLAETARGAHVTGAAYLKPVLAFLHAQHGDYLAAHIGLAQLAGQAVLQIQFGAPETLGLLGPRAP